MPFKPRMDRPVYCSDCFRTGPPGLTAADTGDAPLDPERLARPVAVRWRPRQTVTRDRPWTCHAPSRPTTAVSSSMPSTTEPRGAWSAISADSGSGQAS